MIQFDHQRVGNVEMAKAATIDGIGVQCTRLMGMDFGTVLVPVAAMLMRPRQMRMRRRPLHCHEDGQQDKISRGAIVLLDQEDGRVFKAVGLHCIRTVHGSLYGLPAPPKVG